MPRLNKYCLTITTHHGRHDHTAARTVVKSYHATYDDAVEASYRAPVPPPGPFSRWVDITPKRGKTKRQVWDSALEQVRFMLAQPGQENWSCLFVQAAGDCGIPREQVEAFSEWAKARVLSGSN